MFDTTAVSTGKVFRGEIVGYHGDGGVMPVAIKTLKEGAGQKTQHDFAREAELMTDLQHPNLVCLVGVVLRNTPRCMLFEHSSQGDLHEFLTLHSPRSDVSGCSSDGMMISVEQLMVIAIQVAAGVCDSSTKCALFSASPIALCSLFAYSIMHRD